MKTFVIQCPKCKRFRKHDKWIKNVELEYAVNAQHVEVREVVCENC